MDCADATGCGTGPAATSWDYQVRICWCYTKAVLLIVLMSNLIEWTPSDPATLGTSQKILIRGVASCSGVYTSKNTMGHFEVAYRGGFIFKGPEIRGMHIQYTTRFFVHENLMSGF